MDHEKIENQFPEDGKIQIHESREKNPHSCFTQRKNAHSRVTKKVKGHQGDMNMHIPYTIFELVSIIFN